MNIKNLTLKSFLILFLILLSWPSGQCQENKPVKMAIIGLSHGHVNQLLKRPDKGDITIAAIVEPNRELVRNYADRYGFSMDIVYDDIETMIAEIQPEAVAGFGSIFQHLEIVEKCAPHGIHVMVEKPLAVSYEHALRMEALAKKYNIHLITNYETTWYPTNHETYEIANSGRIGEIKKIVVHDGHRGPAEIGVGKAFLQWLTDPIANGGGAVTDFGCYGANLVTWLVQGQEPVSVTGVLQTLKPDVYPGVDDEATIVIKYPNMQAIIQASWNWPFSRKDMEVYGQTGYVISKDKFNMSYRLSREQEEVNQVMQAREAPYDDPFAFFAALINKKIYLQPYDLSSLENNMMVVRILDAAKKSAETGKAVYCNTTE